MIILINKKRAVLKKGTSFDFIAENRFFTGADSYTLSITFPIKGCAENIDIFGNIYRKDFDFNTTLLDCEIHDRNFHKYGSVSIVSISETEVKTQFLEGRSATNFYSSLDDIYINEITMPPIHAVVQGNSEHYMRSYEEQKEDESNGGIYLGFVCLPWVNNTSGNIQNTMSKDNNEYSFINGRRSGAIAVVGFPFFVEIIRQVLLGAGYECDLSEIENSQWKNLIVCQGFPRVWQMQFMNQILPHWTVSEFLEQVEMFLNGTFELDDKNRMMTFSFNCNTISHLPVVTITNVLESHSVDIADKDDGKDDYIEQKNMAYQDCDHQMWKFYDCNWALANISISTYADVTTMRNALDSYLDCAGPSRAEVYRNLHYCTAEDTYFVLKCVGSETIGRVIHHYMRYQPVNMFAPRIINQDENAEIVEMCIVPACIDNTDDSNGDMLFVDCGTLGEDNEDAEDTDSNQTQAVNSLKSGKNRRKRNSLIKSMWLSGMAT